MAPSMEAKDTKIKKRSLRKRISPDQLEYMVTFMEANPNLKNGVLTQNFTKRDRKNKWEELSKSLNALVGSIKPPQSWKKAWNDQKTYVRTKAAKAKKGESEDGSSSSEKLSPMEERILNLVGWGQTIVESNVVEIKVFAQPSETEPVFSDEDSEFNEEAIDREPLLSEEDTEFNGKVEDDIPLESIAVPVPEDSINPPPKKQKMTLCGMTAAALEELKHHGQLMARNAAVQKETLSVLKVISSSLQSISTNLEKIADVAVNRI